MQNLNLETEVTTHIPEEMEMGAGIISETQTSLDRVEINAIDLKDAHNQIGKLCEPQIRIYLNERDTFSNKSIINARNNITKMQASVNKSNHSERSAILSPDEQQAIINGHKKMLQCVEAWGDGANLRSIYLEKGLPEIIDGKEVTILELAIALQNDNVGCLTGMQLKEGPNGPRIYAWHVEEEVSYSFKGEKTTGSTEVQFSIPPTEVTINISSQTEGIKKATTFLYPHLMPFVGFVYVNGEQGDQSYFQAGDSLYTRDAYHKGGYLASLASWMIFYLRNQVAAEKVLNTIRPFRDGTAFNIIEKIEGNYSAKKVMTGGNIVQAVSLARLQNSVTTIRQDNMYPVGETGQIIKSSYPAGTNDDKAWFSKRDDQHTRAITSLVPNEPNLKAKLAILHMLGATKQEDYGLNSPYSHNWNVVSFGPEGSSCWSGSGNVSEKILNEIANINSEEQLQKLGIRIH